MVWDDDEVFVPLQALQDNGSPRIEEIGHRNSLVFSNQDSKEQYHLLLRVSSDRGTIPGIVIKSTDGIPKLKRVMSAGKRSDPGKQDINHMKTMFAKPNLPPMLPKPHKLGT
jgi:hypothetical protein